MSHLQHLVSTPPSWLAFPLLLVACLPLLWLSVSRLVFHPLAKYPGPPLAALTDLYAAYHAWMGDIHEDMLRCHRRYGPRVRYAPTRVLFNTEQALKDIYGPNKNVVKSSAYAALTHRTQNVLTLIDRKEHGRRRRMLGAKLSESAIDVHEPRMLRVIDRFVESLGSSKSVDMSERCSMLTFDLMAEAIFGLNYDLIDLPESRGIVGAMHASNARVSTLYQAGWLKWRPLDRAVFKKAIAARSLIINFVNDVVRRKVKGSTGKDGAIDSSVFAQLRQSKDSQTGASLTTSELASESTTLMFAGTDTTAAALAAIFYRLAENPDALKRATGEVRAKFPEGTPLKGGSSLSECTFLRSCIDESLRLHPPAGSALWRETLEGGAVVDGEFIPAGLDVGVSLYAIQRNEAYFQKPDEFDPLRADALRPAFNPFSVGPRGCLGKALAVRELTLVVARVLQTMDITHDGALSFEAYDHISATTHGPRLVFDAVGS